MTRGILEAGKELGETMSNRLQVFPPIDNALGLKIKSGAARLVFRGEFRFSGVHGAEYVQSFGLIFDWRARRFQPMGAQYNKRTRQQPEPMVAALEKTPLNSVQRPQARKRTGPIWARCVCYLCRIFPALGSKWA